MVRRSLRTSVIGTTVLAGVLAGCSGSGASAPGGLEKTNLVVAAAPALDSAGVYIAQERGLFAAEGLHVTIVPATSSAEAIREQVARKLDVTSGAYPSYIQADAQQGAKLRVLVAGSTMEPATEQILVSRNSQIDQVSQLRGKTIGVNANDNIGTLLVESLLSENAVPLNTVKFAVIPFPDMGKALASHQIDAAWLPEPFITENEESIGAQPLVDADQGAAESLPIAGYMVTQSWLDKYPHTAAAFKAALVKAQGIAAANVAAVQQAMARFAGVPKQSAAVVAAPGFPTQTTAGPLQRVISLMVNYGLLTAGYNASLMIAKLAD